MIEKRDKTSTHINVVKSSKGICSKRSFLSLKTPLVCTVFTREDAQRAEAGCYSKKIIFLEFQEKLLLRFTDL